MRALSLRDGVVALGELPAPVPAAGEALVRVTSAGICNTDLELARGYMGYAGVLGHELCGVVERCDDARWVGRRVAGEINLACGRCSTCAAGLGRHCPTRTVMGIVGKQGCFADHVTLPVANLHALPDALDDVRACFVEPTAAAFEILEQVALAPRSRVAVLGDGKLGLLVAQVLAQHGADTLLVGRHARKLAIAREELGLETAAGADELPGKSFDVVVEATGSPDGLATAVALTRPRGTIVLKSTYHGELRLYAAPIVIDELTLVGSRCGPFAPAIEALTSGRVRPEPMVDAVLPLAQAEEAMRRAATPGTLKVILDMRAGA
jgi:threonine dehydrogenase-like Zn-dependent dehydrogenase